MKKLLIGYIIISLLLVLDLSLYFKWHISLIGYWSDRVLFWLWLLMTVLVIKQGWKRRITKIYAGGLAALLMLSMLPMLIPFTSIIIVGFGLDRDYYKNVDDHIRIQRTGKSLITRPTLEVIEKTGLYEQLIGSVSAYDIGNEDSTYSMQDFQTLKVLEQTKDSIQVELVFKQGKVTTWMRNE